MQNGNFLNFFPHVHSLQALRIESKPAFSRNTNLLHYRNWFAQTSNHNPLMTLITAQGLGQNSVERTNLIVE